MNMKKVLLLILSLLMVGNFVSCHHKHKQETGETAPVADKKKSPPPPPNPPNPPEQPKIVNCEESFINAYALVLENIKDFEMSRYAKSDMDADRCKVLEIEICLDNAKIACDTFQEKYKGNEKCQVVTSIETVPVKILSPADLDAPCKKNAEDYLHFMPIIEKLLRL